MLCVIKPVFCLLLALQVYGLAQTTLPRPQRHDQRVALTDTTVIQLSKGITIEKNSFRFEKATVQELMQLVTYCYHIPVVYKGKISKGAFTGSINRKIPLEGILRLFRNQGVPLSYDGKKVTVKE